MSSLIIGISFLMIVIGALHVYDAFLVSTRRGFNRHGLLIMSVGAVMVLCYGAVAWSSSFLSFEGGLPRVAVSFVVMMAFAYLIGFALFLFAFFLAMRRPVRRGYRFIVVLGAGLVDGVRVSRSLRNRLEVAIAAFFAAEAPVAPCVIVSGGRGGDEEVTEAHAMQSYLVGRGVPSSLIMEEGSSMTTRENLRFSHRLVEERGGARGKGQDVLIVTSNFHVVRAAWIARREGWGEASVAGCSTSAHYFLGAIVREYAGILGVEHKRVLAITLICLVLSFAQLI